MAIVVAWKIEKIVQAITAGFLRRYGSVLPKKAIPTQPTNWHTAKI
jgi:hypothetical protein